MINKTENQAVCYLCNILDEQTKEQRAIIYDSPAANKKVFDVCHALKQKFKQVYVVTMARGMQKGKKYVFSAMAKEVGGIPVLYGKYTPLPVLTYITSSVSLIFLIWRVTKQQKDKTLHLLVYNRNWLYVPSLFLARLLNVKCYLDLEDGALVDTSNRIGIIKYTLLKITFDFLCHHGSILVTPGLINQVRTLNNTVCYGIAEKPTQNIIHNWRNETIRFLFGGTLMRETGALLLMDAVRILNKNYYIYRTSLTIVITGHGTYADELAKFSEAEGKDWIEFKGRVSIEEYKNLLNTSHVGLCLKLPSSEMGTTTFPSKVIEFASQGKLVLTTKLQHVHDLLGLEGAYYLEDENPLTLAKAIINIVSNRDESIKWANVGQQRSLSECDPEKVVDNISRLFKEYYS